MFPNIQLDSSDSSRSQITHCDFLVSNASRHLVSSTSCLTKMGQKCRFMAFVSYLQGSCIPLVFQFQVLPNHGPARIDYNKNCSCHPRLVTITYSTDHIKSILRNFPPSSPAVLDILEVILRPTKMFELFSSSHYS